MNEDYCSYELSKALKACGFDEPCLTFYDTNKELGRALDTDNFNHLGETYQGEWFTDTISAPTLWQAQKWLREKKKMHCQVLLNGVRSMFFWQVREMVGNGRYADSKRQYDVYEDAMSDCIASALELIEQENK